MALLQQWRNVGERFSGKYADRFNTQRFKTVAKQLPRWLLILGIIILAWQLATVTWFLLGADKRDDAPLIAGNKKKVTHQEEPKQAVAYDLFEEQREVPKKVDKPVRRNLNLELHGVIAGAEPKQGSALISPKNSVPQVYRVGEQVTPGVILDEIYPTYVLLLSGDVYEQLSLPKSNIGLNAAPKAPPGTQVAREGEPVVINKPNVTRKLARYRKQLKQNPMALARLLRGVPKERDGKIYGVQISRGNDPALINEIGLKDKDVLTSINGVALNDIKQLPVLIKTLSEDDRFDIVLERAGVAQSVSIYLEPQD